MTTRCFAFGCSLTKYCWGTWADLVGSNFDEFYNLGRGGSSNTFIMNRVIELDSKVGFNPLTDYVIVGLSGIFRFSYLKNRRWQTQGDFFDPFIDENNQLLMRHRPELFPFKEETWNCNFGMYETWMAFTAIRTLLTAKKIRHKIIMGIDNSCFVKNYDLLGLDQTSLELFADIESKLDVKTSLEEFKAGRSDNPVIFNDGRVDGHPSQAAGFDYIKVFMPEFNTSRSKQFYEDIESIFDRESMAKQNAAWAKFYFDRFPLTRKYEQILIG